METVTDACLFLEVDPSTIEDIANLIKRKLEEFDIEAKLSQQVHHISIGYLVGNAETALITQVAEEIASNSLSLKATGIEVLPGATTNRDYIALRVDGNEDLQRAINLISEVFNVREFSNGFKTHFSILSIEKGLLNPVELEALARVLEILALGLIPTIKLRIDSISVFSKDYQRVTRVPVGA